MYEDDIGEVDTVPVTPGSSSRRSSVQEDSPGMRDSVTEYGDFFELPSQMSSSGGANDQTGNKGSSSGDGEHAPVLVGGKTFSRMAPKSAVKVTPCGSGHL